MVALAVRRVKATETACLTHVTGFLRFFPAILFFATIVVLQISDRFLLLFHTDRMFFVRIRRIFLAWSSELVWQIRFFLLGRISTNSPRLKLLKN